ncbi:membrane skeletal protein [Plasmodium ovale wallikeri]|uniref:Membrane skeletal protein n=1 Tax=Plasmodium ovale wallikeri TaxID=864142 RepID=A0A1A8YSV5_PLAOA|nr:membrane skeletal protein [Plasmodium ovale wallikeri]SBT35146.1 membrane skeletal protein [Plasmodium ovale wallikeri]
MHIFCTSFLVKMFDACKINSNCCQEEGEETRELMQEENHDMYEQHMVQGHGGLKKIIEGEPDIAKAIEISQHTEREYVSFSQHGCMHATVEVPFVRTIETTVPKITYENKIREVPNFLLGRCSSLQFCFHPGTQVVEVPEVKFVDKIVDVPRIQYCFKYVPKVEVQENIIKRPVFEKKIVEKIVEVPRVKEMKRFQEVETVEYVIKYVPKMSEEGKDTFGADLKEGEKEDAVEHSRSNTIEMGKNMEDTNLVYEQTREGYDLHGDRNSAEGARLVRSTPVDVDHGQFLHQGMALNQKDVFTGVQEMYPYIFTRSMQECGREAQQEGFPNFGLRNELSMMQLKEKTNSLLPTPRIEQVFKPKIVKNVEVQKHVPISVDVPVPYMVPKPVVVNVEVPVLKFRDTFVPVPVRRKIIPKIKWISDVYQVDCIKERPYLKIQDIIKPIPCDVEIKYRKRGNMEISIPTTGVSPKEGHVRRSNGGPRARCSSVPLICLRRFEAFTLVSLYVCILFCQFFDACSASRLPLFNIFFAVEGEEENRRDSRTEEDESEREENSKEGTEFYGEDMRSKEEDDNDERSEKEESGEKEEGVHKEEVEEEEVGEKEERRKREEDADEGYGNGREEIEEQEKVHSEQNIFYADETRENHETVCRQQRDGKMSKVCCVERDIYGEGTSVDEERYNFECMEEFKDEMKSRNTLDEEQPTLSLYPSHPLAMTYLQNRWIKTDTLRTHELYSNNFVKANVTANFNLQKENAVTSDVMSNAHFLRSAGPIISPFKPGNMKNLEKYYNSVIIQNIQKENRKHQHNMYRKKGSTVEDALMKTNETVLRNSYEEERNSEDKCCDYFCKN